MKMVSLKLGETLIKRDGNQVYFIAEIGQNHQGSLEIAKQMILKAKQTGCNCVKFQKSCLNAKFTESALNRTYDGIHSWGKTYGEHKIHLEFSVEQYRILQSFCKEINIDFTASAMDEFSLAELDALKVPFIKIGSGDANNFPLLEKAAKLHCPLAISTGMQTMKTIERIVDIMTKAQKTNFALMHCVSSYPTDAKNCQLRMISLLRHKFPQLVIGYSGHELGLNISKAAVLLGAKIIERHFTLNKQQKGSDHACSLEPYEMAELINSTNKLLIQLKPDEELTNDNIADLLENSSSVIEALSDINNEEPNKYKCIQPCELSCRLKLGKSLVAAKDLFAGHVLSTNDLCVKVSEPNGISAEYIDNVIASELSENVEKDFPIRWDHIIKMESTEF